MAALIPLRKSLLIAVSAVAALLGTGSAFASTGSAHLANDPSGAKVQRSSPVKSALGGQSNDTAYYYYHVQGR